MTAHEVFYKNHGPTTTAYYAQLAKLGPIGRIALYLFRSQKTSTQAKRYHGEFKGVAYDTKNRSLVKLCEILREHAEGCGIVWGFKRDPSARTYNDMVLYVDLPNGQVSFHAPQRIPDCPDYPGEWDQKHASEERICAFCDSVINAANTKQEALSL